MKVEIDLSSTEDSKELIQAMKLVFPSFMIMKQVPDIIEGTIDEQELLDKLEKQESGFLKEQLNEKGFIDASKLALLVGRIAPNEAFPLGKIRFIKD